MASRFSSSLALMTSSPAFSSSSSFSTSGGAIGVSGISVNRAVLVLGVEVKYVAGDLAESPLSEFVKGKI